MTDAGPVVVAVDEQADVPIDLDRWQALAAASLASAGATRGELNLLFVDEGEMTRLNRDHMGEDRPTDVLSFPLDGIDGIDGVDGGGGGGDRGDTGPSLIGDIVVCPAYARRQAPDHAGQAGHDGSLDDELALLVVHGILHVLGHDHAEPDETDVMKAEEQRLLDRHHRAEPSR